MTPLLELSAANQLPLVGGARTEAGDRFGVLGVEQAGFGLLHELFADDAALVANPERRGEQEGHDVDVVEHA